MPPLSSSQRHSRHRRAALRGRSEGSEPRSEVAPKDRGRAPRSLRRIGAAIPVAKRSPPTSRCPPPPRLAPHSRPGPPFAGPSPGAARDPPPPGTASRNPPRAGRRRRAQSTDRGAGLTATAAAGCRGGRGGASPTRCPLARFARSPCAPRGRLESGSFKSIEPVRSGQLCLCLLLCRVFVASRLVLVCPRCIHPYPLSPKQSTFLDWKS